MLKKLSIRGRLMAGFGMVALLSVIMVILGLSSAQSIRGRYTELIEGPIAVVDYIKDARLHINAMARIVRDMALDPDTSNLASRNLRSMHARQQLRKSFPRYRRNI